MSVSIGIRAKPKEIYYSIIKNDGDTTEILSCSKLIIPVSLKLPEKLKYVRTTFLDIIFEFRAVKAGIRITESFAPNEDSSRVCFEAVIQELLASSSVERYFVGQIASISAKLHFPKDNFKKYVSGELNFEEVESWGNFNKEQKESILVGLASLNL